MQWFLVIPPSLSQKVYKSNWEQQREKGFELRLDSLSILTAKAKRDLASDVSLLRICRQPTNDVQWIAI